MEALAKPSGITLAQHVANVVSEAQRILETKPFVIEKYRKRTNYDLSQFLLEACKYHDDGKKHPRWQTACQQDYQFFLDWQKQNGGTYKDFEKAVPRTGPNLMKANVRHEIDSVLQHPNLNDIIAVAIAAHHSKLAHRHSDKWENNEYLGESAKLLWKRFNRLNKKWYCPIKEFREILDEHYAFSAVRSVLQSADRRASIVEGGSFIPEYQKFEYHFPDEWKRRPVQQIAEQSWKDDLLLIRAPTGAGKTDASMLWAKKQIDNGRADRLIVAMPTRFTSNALAVNVTEKLSDTGLYHSTAWFQEFHEKAKESKKAKHEASMLHEFARKLDTAVTVCTIDHLMMALTLTREDHHAIAFNLANSCVVIDEADFYDDFTQANIMVLLEALHQWNVPVMIMSASLPASSLKLYQKTGFKVEEIKEDTSDNERERCKVHSISSYTDIDELEPLLKRCLKQPAIIYANTVNRAVEIYQWFHNSGVKAILYHSRFTEPDKLKKEKKLLEHLGREAWENGTAKGVAILTQIGEMSINISADLMISEICPIDRLVQRAGRLCRFNNEKVGELHVRIPLKEEEVYPAPYGSFVKRQGWKSSPALDKTIDLLECKAYTAQNFVDFINKVYDKLEDFSGKAKSNAKMLKKNFAYNWIINPEAKSDIDDTATEHWKSRDIDNNVTVLTKLPEKQNFSGYIEWQAYKNEHSIDIYAHMIRKGLKAGWLEQSESIYIRDEEMKPIVVKQELKVYSEEKGLFFPKPLDMFLND